MSEDCTRWASLTDRIAVGDAVDREAEAFVVSHARSCEPCGREAALYDELAILLARTEALPIESAEPVRRSRGRRLATIAAAGVAVAAAVTLLMRPSAPRPVTATLILSQGDAPHGAQEAAAGALLGEGEALTTGHGRACLRIEPAVRLCLAEDTTVRFEHLAGPHRVVRLERGRVAAELEPQPPGTSFAIATRDGTSTAVGTAFSVEVAEGAPAVTRVSHGVVLVRTGAAEQRVGAHEIVRGPDAPRALPVGDERADDALLRAPPGARDGAGRATIDSTPAGLDVEIDGVFVGATPLDVLIDPGVHPISIEGLVSAPIVIRAGEHVERTVTSRVVAPPPASASEAPSAPASSVSASAGAIALAPSAPSPATLLGAARAAAARGDRGDAVRSYRELIATSPSSGEAQAALVSLAELELQGGAHAAALADFDRYLARGGALALEARYGRIRALDGLGRTGEARAAADAFVHDYGDSPQAAALRARVP